MKTFLDSSHVLYGFAQERAIEWAQDFVTVPPARDRMISVLEALAGRSSEAEQRRYWRLTNDGSIVFTRDGTIVALRPDVTFGESGVMQHARSQMATCTVLFVSPDQQEESGTLRAKFHFTASELKRVFSWFNRTGLVHALYDERALVEATRLDRMDAAFESFLATA